jgi:hypothetical protein
MFVLNWLVLLAHWHYNCRKFFPLYFFCNGLGDGVAWNSGGSGIVGGVTDPQ